MKIFVDKKKGDVRFQVENDADLNNVRKIAAVVNMEGWKILQDYLDIGREAVIESAKECIDEEKTSKRIAQLRGYDNCVSIPETLVDNARLFVEDVEIKAKEEINEG